MESATATQLEQYYKIIVKPTELDGSPYAGKATDFITKKLGGTAEFNALIQGDPKEILERTQTIVTMGVEITMMSDIEWGEMTPVGEGDEQGWEVAGIASPRHPQAKKLKLRLVLTVLPATEEESKHGLERSIHVTTPDGKGTYMPLSGMQFETFRETLTLKLMEDVENLKEPSEFVDIVGGIILIVIDWLEANGRLVPATLGKD